ncbi:MAG: hypothetical protein QM778_36565 [Myxococcales bacterium]
MTFNLDFALFYAYTLCLFAFLAFWMIPQLFTALRDATRDWIERRRNPGGRAPRPSRPSETRFEAFTRI